jgi:hypothetical protein
MKKNLRRWQENAELIVLVILKSACFLIHAHLHRDLKARDLQKREVVPVPRAVKSARHPALLGK